MYLNFNSLLCSFIFLLFCLLAYVVLLKTMLGLSAEGSLMGEEQRRLREKTVTVNLQQQQLKDDEMRLNELKLQLEEDKLKV